MRQVSFQLKEESLADKTQEQKLARSTSLTVEIPEPFTSLSLIILLGLMSPDPSKIHQIPQIIGRAYI